MRPLRLASIVVVIGAALVFGTITGEAHKPITSPFTFNEDVFPIVRARCGACHVPGGVAPMSLMTHTDAVPWAESMRTELIAGHMPPTIVESAPGVFRNDARLTGRELNVLLTWATGGTPPGDPAKAPAPVTLDTTWPLGPPDVELPLTAVTIAEDAQERSVSFVAATGLVERRRLRAIDLRPGTTAIVRSAQVRVITGAAKTATDAAPERVVALWQPGRSTVAADGGAFDLPAGAELSVVIRYKKTWQYEGKGLSDRSTVGLYFAPASAPIIDALPVTDTTTLTRDTRALAIYPDPTLGQVHVTVEATRPDGSRQQLLSAYPQPAWARRYWYAEPVALPSGTKINVTIDPYDEAALLPPGATPPQPSTVTPVRRVVLDVVP